MSQIQLDFQRYEFKYVIPRALCDPIDQFVQCFAKPDLFTRKNPEGYYTITSLYLDNPQLTFHLAKGRKEVNRVKLRLRTYGNSIENPVFAEIKRKVKGTIVKKRVRILDKDWQQLARTGFHTLHTRTERDAQAMEAFSQIQQNYGAYPSMLVRYNRRAYESTIDDYARVTFDSALCCQRPTGYQLVPQDQNWMFIDNPVQTECVHRSGLVLELKFAGVAPRWMEELVQYFGLQRRGFSKYSASVERGLDCYRYDTGHRMPIW